MVMLLCAGGELQAHAAASKAIFFSSMVNHSTLIKGKKKPRQNNFINSVMDQLLLSKVEAK